MTGVPHAMRLDDAEAERFVEVDEMEERVRRAERRRSVDRIDRAEIADPIAIEVRLHLVAEVPLVLDDAGDVEAAARPLGDLDGVRRALVGMDASEEEQVFTGSRVEIEVVGVDAVMHRRGVVQVRVPIGIADRDVRRRGVVPLVHRHDPWRREAVDRRDDRRGDEAAVASAGRKSNPLWMMSNSSARSKTDAMCTHSATFGSIESSSDQP